MISISIMLAVVIDWLAGEPKHWHPLIGFGRLASYVEARFNLKNPGFMSRGTVCSRFFLSLSMGSWRNKVSGVLALLLLCLPFPLVWQYFILHIESSPVAVYLLDALLLYLTIGHRSLWDHITPIIEALFQQDEVSARHHTAMIVSRDPEALNIEVSAIESVLENGNDAVFGALFWFVVAGGAGAVFYRLVNTLDAMWGYRTERYRHFGWAAAKLDDALNYLPARCTALSYAVLSDCFTALQCWKEQASAHPSPNGGPVITAGAGALGVIVGGPTRYHGVWHDKPVLGSGQAPNAADIQRAMWLVSQALLLWVSLVCCADLLVFILPIGSWN